MSDAERLAGYVAVWWEAVDSFTHLLEKVPPEEWSTPTDLPGWDVHAVAAHTAHLEALLGGRPHEDVEIGDVPAPGLFGAIGWTTGLLLRNRPLDVWMHEQDVRRAVGLPGGLDSAPAVHSAVYLLESFPYVVGKRAQAPVGTTARISVGGHEPVTVTVGDDGRARVAEVEGEPTVGLAMDRETFLVRSGGRRAAEAGTIGTTGDAALAARIIDSMGVTP